MIAFESDRYVAAWRVRARLLRRLAGELQLTPTSALSCRSAEICVPWVAHSSDKTIRRARQLARPLNVRPLADAIAAHELLTAARPHKRGKIVIELNHR